MKKNRCGQSTPLSKKQFQELITQFDKDHHRLIFALCWYTMERPGAILKLQVTDVYLDARRRVSHPEIVIPCWSRKDRKTRTVQVSPALRQELRAFTPPLEGWLFPSPIHPGKPLSFDAWDEVLRRTFRKLGMVGYSSYSLRRGAITHLHTIGRSVREIQKAVGHASINTTQIYIDVAEANQTQVMALL
jgi:integrase/recombinase XerD